MQQRRLCFDQVDLRTPNGFKPARVIQDELAVPNCMKLGIDRLGHQIETEDFTGEQVGMGADNMMSSYTPEYDVSADGARFVVTQRLER